LSKIFHSAGGVDLRSRCGVLIYGARKGARFGCLNCGRLWKITEWGRIWNWPHRIADRKPGVVVKSEWAK